METSREVMEFDIITRKRCVMKKIIQSSFYQKYHWNLVGGIVFLLIVIGMKFTGNLFVPRWVYVAAAFILWIIQMLLVKVYEKKELKKEEYKTGLKWLLLPLLLVLMEWYDNLGPTIY